MITLFNLLRGLWHAVTCICEIIGYGWSFVWALICPRAALAAQSPRTLFPPWGVSAHSHDPKNARKPA